jgi:hypothetical protein
MAGKAHIRKLGGRIMRFNTDGTVEDITNIKTSEVSSPKPVLDQMKEKVSEAVQAVEEVVKPKAKRGRKPKASSDS